MSKFLDMDYTMAGESSKINDALLAVPQLQKPCQGKANYLVEHYFDTVKKTLKYFLQPDFSVQLEEFVDRNSDLLDSKNSVEDFESPSDCYSSCTTDDAEVIPSSYPDSEVCFDLKYNLDSPGDIISHTHSTWIFDFETFTYEGMVEGKTLPFEEPIINDNFIQVASRVLSTKVLLSRLQMILVEDPLFDSNGKPWLEQNIFKESHNLESLIPAVINPYVTETSDLSLHDGFEKKHAEEFFIPFVKNSIPLSYTEDLEMMTTNVANLYDKQGITSKELDFSDEALLNQECEVFVLDILPDLPNDTVANKSFVDLNKRDTEVQCTAPSPFIGFPTPSIARTDNVNEFCQNLEQNLGLPSDELQGDFILVSQKEEDLIRECMVNLHYDENRLREPVFHKATLTDPVLEAFQYLDHPSVKDRCLIMEDASLKNLSEDLHEDLRNPLFQVSTLKCELDLNDSLLSEEHVNLEVTKQDSHQYETLIQDSSLHSVKSTEPHTYLEEKSNSLNIGNDPLDTFMLCRTNTVQIKNNEEKTSSVINEMNESNTVIKDSSDDESLHENEQEYASKIMKIPFTGPYVEVMKCITDYVSPHFDKAKQYGRVPHNKSFIDVSVDKIRFLYKESEQLCSKDKSPYTSRNEVNEFQRNLLQSHAILLHGRITLDLLLHACLESAITHLSSCIDSDNKNVGGSLVYLHEDLFKTHAKFMELNFHHPKFTALASELKSLNGNEDKILILAPNGLLSLQQALQRMLHREISLPVHVIHGKEGLENSSAKQGISILLEGGEMGKKTMEQYSYIIQYSAVNPKIRFLCDSMRISYIGFISEVPPQSCCLSGSISDTSVSVPLTVISSNEVMQYKNLVYLLEARYNIMIVERNYLAMKQAPSLYYADLILSLHHCIVLLAIHEIYDLWDLETFITRMVAVGFQCSFCYVIAHGIGAPSRYLLGKNVLLNLYKLRASLSNLSRSSSFTTTYKILISSNEEEVALNIRAIADQALCQQEGNSTTFTIKTEMSNEETFLLQFACFNSFSALRFLSLWTVDEVLNLDPMTIKRNIPNISNNFLEIFEASVSKMEETDCISISSESSPGLSVISSKSQSSVISAEEGSMTPEFTIISEDDNLSLVPSNHSERSVHENRHGHALESEGTQVYIERRQDAPNLLKNKCVDRQQRGLIENIKCSSLFPEPLGLALQEIVPQHDFEIKEQRKRSAISGVEDAYLKIPKIACGFTDQPPVFQTLPKRKTSDKHFSMTRDKTDRQYLCERERLDENGFFVMTKPQECHSNTTFMESYRDKQVQNDCFNSNTDYYGMIDGNSRIYPLCEEAEKNVFISSECLKSSHTVYEKDMDKDFSDVEKKSLQFQHADSKNFNKTFPERTFLKPTLNFDFNENNPIQEPKTAFCKYKSDMQTYLSLVSAQETKHTNTYGIFSDKIYRTIYKNDEMNNARQTFNHNSMLNSEINTSGTLASSKHYLCTDNENIVKRDRSPVTYLQPQINSSKLFAKGQNSYTLNDISFPGKTLASRGKHESDKISHFHFSESCSKFNCKSGTNYCHESSSSTKPLSQRRHTNQSESSCLEYSTFPSFLEEYIKPQRRIDSHSASFPNDLHSKMRAYKQRQNKEINFTENYRSHQPAPEVPKSVKHDSAQLQKYCHPKHFKEYAYSPKYERPTWCSKPGHKNTIQRNEDSLHFLRESENFDQRATLFERQIENIHPRTTSFVPSPPMDFMEDVLRNVSD